MKKKLLTLMVMTTFVLNIFGTGIAGATSHKRDIDVVVKRGGDVRLRNEFKDLASAAWALKEISKMQAQDVIKGYNDGTFRPHKSITKVEAVAMAVRLMGLEDEAKKLNESLQSVSSSVYDNVYDSVSNNDDLPYADSNKIDPWARGYIKLALDKKIIDPTYDNFQPNKPASRLWVSVLLTKALGLQTEAEANKGVVLPFKDEAGIPDHLKGYVLIALNKGLVKGFPGNTFQPNKPVTRAEMAAFLNRTDEQLVTPDKQRVQGFVNAVNLTTPSITLSKDQTVTPADSPTVISNDNSAVNSVYTSNLQTFNISSYAIVLIDNKLGQLSDVTVGAKVTLGLKDDKVVYVEVASPELVREVELVVIVKKDVKIIKKEKEQDKNEGYELD